MNYDLQRQELYLVEVRPPNSPVRQFVAEYYSVSWDRSRPEPCLYAGDQQGGRLLEIKNPNDPVIERNYRLYRTNGLFETRFRFSEFPSDKCRSWTLHHLWELLYRHGSFILISVKYSITYFQCRKRCTFLICNVSLWNCACAILPLRKRVHNNVIGLQAVAVFEMIVVHVLLLLAITHQCLGKLSQAMYTLLSLAALLCLQMALYQCLVTER